MSTAIAKNLQVGTSGTATDNFTIFQPATPDGTLRIGNGNTGITTSLVALNSSGNVGIGTSTPGAKLEIGALGVFRMQTGATLFNVTPTAGANDFLVWNTSNSGSGFAWNTNSTESMRIDPSGNLLVGTTTTAFGGGERFSVVTSGTGNIGAGFKGTRNILVGIWNSTTGSSELIRFAAGSGGTTVGTITTDGSSSTAYNTSSDYRLKNITGPITTSGAYIDSLNPVEGTWKADGSTFVGLIAHEVQEASRTNVATGTKDGEEMQGMDYSSAEIIANLIAEVKSLRQRLAAAGI